MGSEEQPGSHPFPQHRAQTSPQWQCAALWGERAPFWGCPQHCPVGESHRGGEQTCGSATGKSKQAGARHLPWQRPAAGRARLQFEGRAEAGAGPGLPTPSPGLRETCPNGQRGGGPGPGRRTSSPCQELHGKDKGKLSSLRAQQAPAEPSDIETICEGFGRHETASPGMGGCFSCSFQAAGLPQNPPGRGWGIPEGPAGPWGCPGSDPCTDTSGPSPECRIEKLPGWFGLRSRPPPTHSL